MARMLQALKNLEARSKSAAAKGWLAHLADQPLGAEQRTMAVAMPSIAEIRSENGASVEQAPEIPVRPVRRAVVGSGRQDGASGRYGRPEAAGRGRPEA